MSSPWGPWQSFYGSILERRRRFWSRRHERLPRPVLSVGNLHWGGTGKTPITAAIAQEFADRGVRVAILSRGYGRRSRGVHLVSRGDGGGPCVGVDVAGDEPFLLARTLPEVAVFVGERRADAGRLALQELEIDLFLLDDGFSHVRLARDADLLVFPGRQPLARAWLAPTGRLREPLRAARHAHAVVLSGDLEPVDDGTLETMRDALADGYDGSIYRTRLRAEVTPAGGRAEGGRESSEARPSRLMLVTGIASPERVARTAEALGLRLVEHLAFGDHHDYPSRSIEHIVQTAERAATPVLTTEKDLVKLEDKLPAQIELHALRVRVDLGNDLRQWLADWWAEQRGGTA